MLAIALLDLTLLMFKEISTWRSQLKLIIKFSFWKNELNCYKNFNWDVAESVIEVPVKYDISPLLNGKIDVLPGYVINEPIVAQEKGYEVNIIWPSDYDIDFYSMTLFTTEKMIRKNPDLVQRFIDATLEGWNYAYENPNEAVSYTLMYSSELNKKHETKMMLASLGLLKPDNNPIGYIDKEVLESMQDILLNNRDMKNKINLDEVYTNNFLDNYYGSNN